MDIKINSLQGIYRKMEASKKRDKEYSPNMSNETEASFSNPFLKKADIGLSSYDAYSLMKNTGAKFSANNLITGSGQPAQEINTERYSIESCSGIAGYWQIYDKMFDQVFIFHPDATTVQTDSNTGKNYIMSNDPFGGLMDVMPVDSELMGALKQFLNVDSVPTMALNKNYVIDVNPLTGIESFKIKGHEGGGFWILTNNEQQREKLQDLANIYKENYPNLIKTDSMAITFAELEIGGMAVRTENGILSLACNGMSFMANEEPPESWGILYPINNTYMYTAIMNAMKEGYITGSDIEDVSKWEAYFKERELEYERVLSDEELRVIVGEQNRKRNADIEMKRDTLGHWYLQ